MHPIYYALMVLAGGLTAYFVYNNTEERHANPTPQRKNASHYPTSSSTRKRTPENTPCCPICLMDVFSSPHEYFSCSHPIHSKCMAEYIRAVGTNAPCPLCRTGRRVPN